VRESTSSSTPHGRSAVWRVLTKPIGPRILPRIRFGTRVKPQAVVAGASLPPMLSDLVTRTVRATRLWRRERVDVARELCSHFAEGLGAGRSEADLARDFGDSAAAAALIRRAKKRNRPLLWHAWVRVWQAAGALLVLCLLLYGVLAARYFTGAPVIARDYRAELNAPIAAVPQADRAWPLYEQAYAAMPRRPDLPRALRMSDSLAAQWGSVLPSDPEWPEIVAYLDSSREAIDLTLRGAGKPALGAELTPAPTGAGDRATAAWESSMLLHSVRFDTVNPIIALMALLRQDAYRAAVEGRGHEVVRNVGAILDMATQLREAPFLLNDQVAYSALARAATVVGNVLEFAPGSLSDEDLVALAHRLSSFAGGSITIRTEGERAIFGDVVQRTFTDDGRGDGRLTSAGEHHLESMGGSYQMDDSTVAVLAGPLAGAIAPGRRTTVELYDRMMDAVLREAAKPLYARTEYPDAVLSKDLQAYERAAPIPIHLLMPALTAMGMVTETVTVRRDATLTAIALELFRRQKEHYPQTLQELVPRFLPALPLDRFDGGPLKYTLRGGKPLIYSVGKDGVDDGGRMPEGEHGNAMAGRWMPPAALQAALKHGKFEPDSGLGGDWVLWPPVADPPPGPLRTAPPPRSP
jgi:hypothetical protein